MYKTIVLGPGAIRGISILGAFYELELNNMIERNEVENYAGISIGSVLALFLSMGFEVRKIFNMFTEKMDRKIKVFSILTEFGLDDGLGLECMLKKYMGEHHNITFQEHYDLFGKGLYIQATNLNMLQAEIYSYKTHGKMKVKDAIRRSVSIPLFFKPVHCTSTGHHFIDGALVDDTALLSMFDTETTLVIELKDIDPTHPEKLASFPAFFQQILILLLHRKNSNDESKHCRLQIEASVFCRTGRLLWETKEQLQELWWRGRKAAAKKFVHPLRKSCDENEDRTKLTTYNLVHSPDT